jgi:hypothetical protein
MNLHTNLIPTLLKSALIYAAFFVGLSAASSDILPPLQEWHGKSESLIQGSDNPWQTPAEKTHLTDTPNYLDSIAFLKKLVASDTRLQLISLGKSPQQRDIWMVIATQQGIKDAATLHKNNKPTLLVQAGIHSGEIDGKDAGFMLLRDIIHGNKGHLLEKVNLLFVPILSVDAHERRSPFNRVNQRGPTQMGWRTNAQNLNLNRDYSKLDTLELQHMIRAINHWKPDLYFDVHVTDGEDYQYDITYGFTGTHGDSPNISQWLATVLRPSVDKALADNGHLGGPLTFGVNSMDFSQGIVGWTASPRFSNGYGDVRKLPTILVENHSLKPYRRRVLGTYVMLEASLKLLAEKGAELIQRTQQDRISRPANQVVAWQVNKTNPGFMDFLGIAYKQAKDEITGIDYIQWTGQNKTYKNLPVYRVNKAKIQVEVPKSYWIPTQYFEVIKRLKNHGIKLKVHSKPTTIKGIQKIAKDYSFQPKPFEGRQMVTSTFDQHTAEYILPANSVEVFTDQELGALVVALLEPTAVDSFFSWGFFNQMFQRTEYIENYAIIPLARKLFNSKPELKLEFESKLKTDQSFSKDKKAQLQWIYSKSKYFDQEYLKYPVIIEMKSDEIPN